MAAAPQSGGDGGSAHELLTTLLGSPEAAAEAVASDSSLLALSDFDPAMETVLERLGEAGLSQEQLLRLARVCQDLAKMCAVHSVESVAEELYAGDWHAAMLDCLRGWPEGASTLWCPRGVLELLEEAGLAVANEAGRRCVLQYIQVRCLPG